MRVPSVLDLAVNSRFSVALQPVPSTQVTQEGLPKGLYTTLSTVLVATPSKYLVLVEVAPNQGFSLVGSPPKAEKFKVSVQRVKVYFQVTL